MPVQINRDNSVISTEKKQKMVSDYLEPLLSANTPLEVIEEVLLEEIAEFKEKAKNATNEEDKKQFEQSEKNRSIVLAELKKEKEIAAVVNEFNEANDKLIAEYSQTLKQCEELFDYITNIDLSVQKDFTKLKKALIDKETIFSAQIIKQSNQLKAVEQVYNKLEGMQPRYSVLESCSKKLAKVQHKPRDWVKEQYILGLKKIQELEAEKSKNSYSYEQKQITEIINRINQTLNQDLPIVLENARNIEEIKKEAYKELGIDLEEEQTSKQKSKNETDTATSGGSETDTSSKKPTNTGENKDEEQTIVTRPAKTKDSEDFKKAVEEYISIVNLINKNIERLEELNGAQDMYTFDPEENLDKMISSYEEAENVVKHIDGLKRRLLDFEYERYINEHIIITLDENVKKAQIKKIEHNSELESFMEQHNGVVKMCYEKLQEIAQQDYQNNPELQAKIKMYKEIISIQHMLINRRLIEERKNNKEFDAIKFMREHRVEIKKPSFDDKKGTKKTDDQVDKPAPKPAVTTDDKKNADEEAYKNDNKQIINEINQLLDEYQREYILLYGQLEYSKAEIGIDEQAREEVATREKSITDEVTRMKNIVLEKIAQSGLSDRRKTELIQKFESLNQVVEKMVKSKIETPTYLRLIELKKDVEEILIVSKELVRLSETSVSSDEYTKTLEKFNNLTSTLQTKYSDLDLKVTKQSGSTVKIDYVVDKKQKKSCSISIKSKKAKQALTTSSNANKRFKVQFKEEKLKFKTDVADVDRRKALIATVEKIKVSLLTQRIKIEYTKQLVEDLKKLKVNLEIQASAENKAKINVSLAKDSKNQKTEYRYIDDIENLSSAQVVYRNMDTGEEELRYELLADQDLQAELENRRMSR